MNENMFIDIFDRSKFLAHYGTKRHSGRYPYGSGEDPYQHEDSSFMKDYKKYKDEGMNDTEIAKAMNMSSTELRERKTIERNEKKAYDRRYAMKLKEKGYSNVAIGKRMGLPDTTVGNLLREAGTVKKTKIDTTVEALKKNVDDKTYIDVGKGVNIDLNVTETCMKSAIRSLTDEGYKLYHVKVQQLGTGNYTDVKVLCPPGTTYQELMKNRGNIKSITDYVSDDGKTVLGIKPPVSIDSKRVKVKYAEEGGNKMDGVIQLRRGVEDISLGDSQYAQVRIAVDGSHYLKGMAIYSDDMPDGVDVIFNTNKHEGTPMLGPKDNSVLKPLKNDPDNPFGATIKPGGQRSYISEDGKEHQSAINIVNEEGDWNKWSRNLASQMLSKQSPQLAKRQLDLAYAEKKEEYDSIMSLTNPAIKEKMLIKFADSCDKAAVTLKAAALPRQASKVILPVPELKDNEIYAPGYRDGEEVVLIRYPHAGIFEIPKLIVNNKNKAAKSVMFNATDAVGINSNVAARLSGADFDGDTVLVIPTANVKIKTSPPLEGLKNFDPKEAYPKYDGMKVMSEDYKQIQMGIVSNLITDMTLKGAPPDELERAVKHSMVVIDAVKHELDYRGSYEDNRIAELHKLYQPEGGASTLISRAKNEVDVPKRKVRYNIDPDTGKKIYIETGEKKVKLVGRDPETGKKIYQQTDDPVLEKSTRMAEADDAYTLSSGYKMEDIYAGYANDVKALANLSRKESEKVRTSEHYSVDPSAKEKYADQVASLNSKLKLSQQNAPRERQAQIQANEIVDMKKRENPNLTKEDIKKLSNQALAASRVKYGANKKNTQIEITDEEWEAIQNKAIPYTTLKNIIDNTDLDKFKERAMPREAKYTITDSKRNLAISMHNAGYSLADIADRIGISTSTISGIINGNE